MSIRSQFEALTLSKIGAFVAGLAAAMVVVWYCYHSGSRQLALISIVAATFGWVVGLLSAPRSREEKSHFSELAKVISGFVTGYLLSKIDPLIQWLSEASSEGEPRLMTQPYAEQFLVALASFGIAMLFVFNARLYWSDTTKMGPKKVPSDPAEASPP